MDQSASADAQAILNGVASGFIADTAFRHLGFVLVALIILCGAFSFIAKRGEHSLGLSIKGAVDAIEAAAKIYVDERGKYGTVWPITLFLVALFTGAVAIVLAVIQ